MLTLLLCVKSLWFLCKCSIIQACQLHTFRLSVAQEKNQALVHVSACTPACANKTFIWTSQSCLCPSLVFGLLQTCQSSSYGPVCAFLVWCCFGHFATEITSEIYDLNRNTKQNFTRMWFVAFVLCVFMLASVFKNTLSKVCILDILEKLEKR